MDSPHRADEAVEPTLPQPPEPPPYEAAPPAPRYSAELPSAPLRRRPNLVWYGALLLAAIVVLGGFGMLYGDDTSWQHRANELQNQNAALHSQLLNSQTSLADTQKQVASLQADLQHPHVGIWNVQQEIKGPDWYLVGGVPDTFTYQLRATATGPMNVSILTFEQFAAAVECIDNGDGNTNYCMHHSRKGTTKSWLGVTSVSYDFHLAEGCANYLVVFTSGSAIKVTPDVSVTYNPASTFTGDC